MRFVTAAEISAALTFPELVDTLAQAFRTAIAVPRRHHHAIPRTGGDASLILMPAWHEADGFIGVKVVTVFPDNRMRAKPSVIGTYLLLSGDSGETLAAFDGVALTLWRTAAASALAARHLARPDARRLVMFGAGALAPYLIAAHASVRPIAEVAIVNRTLERAEALARSLGRPGLSIHATGDAAAALAEADIVSAATLSATPLIAGSHLRAGAHVDLVGGFTPAMREADDETIRRARIHVDTRDGALREAGDIVQPMAARLIDAADIEGDLFDLCRGTVAGRRSAEEITLFKSVGTAIEDLAAAVHVWRRLS